MAMDHHPVPVAETTRRIPGAVRSGGGLDPVGGLATGHVEYDLFGADPSELTDRYRYGVGEGPHWGPTRGTVELLASIDTLQGPLADREHTPMTTETTELTNGSEQFTEHADSTTPTVDPYAPPTERDRCAARVRNRGRCSARTYRHRPPQRGGEP